MTVQCIAGRMAEQGYGHCALERSTAAFESATYARHCHTFEAADQEAVQKRTDWLTAKKQQFLKEVLSHDET